MTVWKSLTSPWSKYSSAEHLPVPVVTRDACLDSLSHAHIAELTSLLDTRGRLWNTDTLELLEGALEHIRRGRFRGRAVFLELLD